MSEQAYRWSSKSLDELVDFYEHEIAPERRREGYDPNQDIPSYQWLVDHGYSGLQYAVREHHEMTLSEFFVQAIDSAMTPQRTARRGPSTTSK